eukprot:COSAG01_NODE_373_length_17991_cov_284.890075_20_plen_234_part_00
MEISCCERKQEGEFLVDLGIPSNNKSDCLVDCCGAGTPRPGVITMVATARCRTVWRPPFLLLVLVMPPPPLWSTAVTPGEPTDDVPPSPAVVPRTIFTFWGERRYPEAARRRLHRLAAAPQPRLARRPPPPGCASHGRSGRCPASALTAAPPRTADRATGCLPAWACPGEARPRATPGRGPQPAAAVRLVPPRGVGALRRRLARRHHHRARGGAVGAAILTQNGQPLSRRACS